MEVWMGDMQCDVCVIGGGLIGTSVAYHLQKAGASVVLLERNDLASGASGASFGWAAVHFASYMTHYPRFHMRFMRAGLEVFRTTAEMFGEAVEYRPFGGMSLIYDRDAWEAKRRLAAELTEEGIPVHVLTQAEALEIEPGLAGPFIGALWSPREAIANPLLLVRRWAEEARGDGTRILVGVPATGLLVEERRVRGVLTPHGQIRADAVVNAAGLQAPAIGMMAGIKVPIVPNRGQQLILQRTKPVLRRVVYGRIPAAQLASGNVLVGGIREAGESENRVTLEAIRLMSREASEMIPAVRPLNVVRAFSGIRPVPEDGMPILGWAPGARGLILANLHFGFTLAPLVGQLITELLISGKTPSQLEPYSLGRLAA